MASFFRYGCGYLGKDRCGGLVELSFDKVGQIVSILFGYVIHMIAIIVVMYPFNPIEVG